MFNSIDSIIIADVSFTFTNWYSSPHNELLIFMKRNPKIKITIPGWDNKIQRNSWTKIKYWSRVLIFNQKNEFLPIKFKSTVMNTIEGYVKGVIKIGNYDYAVISNWIWQHDTIEIQYDLDSAALTREDAKRLKQVKNKIRKFDVFLRVQDIWVIEVCQRDNISAVFK